MRLIQSVRFYRKSRNLAVSPFFIRISRESFGFFDILDGETLESSSGKQNI